MKALEWQPEVTKVRAPTRSDESESDELTKLQRARNKFSSTAIIYQVMISTDDVDEKLVHFVFEVKLNSDFLPTSLLQLTQLGFQLLSVLLLPMSIGIFSSSTVDLIFFVASSS